MAAATAWPSARKATRSSSTSATSRTASVAKLSLKGDIVWSLGAPEEAGVYKQGEAYVPTNVAFAPDGGFYVGDGYGSSYIHQYDKDAKWVRTWGGNGSAAGQAELPARPLVGRPARPHAVAGRRRPGQLAAAILHARRQAHLVHHGAAASLLLQHPRRGAAGARPALRVSRCSTATTSRSSTWATTRRGPSACSKRASADKPQPWQPGRFVHPHHAAFDSDGNIFVVEWVPIGRITRLRHVTRIRPGLTSRCRYVTIRQRRSI